ncbi:MAG TPA: peptidoglycan DD-metalloendopeptidase family protein [Burkholderiales bacterium]|nr:peptidoglycan DD-metalloendopeptidase family protein [Burkholderiales bacterium]
MRARIEALSRELEEKEETRKEARDALRASERAISEANRSLAALEAEGRTLRVDGARLAAERRALQSSLAEREAAIERMLVSRYASGAPDALRAALSGDDPATLARTLHYAGYVSRAAASVLEQYREDLARRERLEREVEERRARLTEVERAARADRDRIVAERKEKRRIFERVAREVRAGRRQIGVLRADETRLARLVERIGRIVYGRVERVPQGAQKSQPFSKLRGKLALPVAGELTGRFGAPRGGSAGVSGVEAKGVFIRAPEGRPVKAIAAGQVVYADWMRGFGNLLIVDHGESYLSIYANNESLLRQVGDAVAPGDTVATTGASGGNEESGLYFELRHLGRAFDPLRWVRLK